MRVRKSLERSEQQRFHVSQPFKFRMSSKKSTGGVTVDYYCDISTDVKMVKPMHNLI